RRSGSSRSVRLGPAPSRSSWGRRDPVVVMEALPWRSQSGGSTRPLSTPVHGPADRAAVARSAVVAQSAVVAHSALVADSAVVATAHVLSPARRTSFHALASPLPISDPLK